MKEIPGDSQRTGQVLTHQQDHYLLLYSRRSRMSTGRALHKNVLDTDIHTSRPMVWMSLTKQSITDFTRVASRLAPQSLKVNVLENVRAWRIKSVEKMILYSDIFTTFYEIQLQKKYSQMCWLMFSQIYWELHSKFTHIYLFIFTDYNHNSVITTSQISEYSGDYYTRVGLNLV